ncbi:hypothetical protein MRB53_019029 [Persea americana]|uniref:Uncharacterized protein n=1 Tax=Persea americana TaxID=3435 RepID=A0ACC2M9K1_PERAE|nr:hypothetical protein MRB53_019029 [Persea americana]
MESFSSSSRSLLLRSMNSSDLQPASGSGILPERWLLLKSRIFKLSSTSSSARRVPERLLLLSFCLFLQAKMIDDQDLGFFANFLGIFIFGLVIAYHYVVADPKYEGN